MAESASTPIGFWLRGIGVDKNQEPTKFPVARYVEDGTAVDLVRVPDKYFFHFDLQVALLRQLRRLFGKEPLLMIGGFGRSEIKFFGNSRLAAIYNARGLRFSDLDWTRQRFVAA